MQKPQKLIVPLEIRIVQSLAIGAMLMMSYALAIVTFDWWEPFEHMQTRAFGLLILPTLITLTARAFAAAREEETT